MLQDYTISRCTRRCHVGQRNLEPGEIYFSVIIPRQDDLVREDISAANWNGPPIDAIGWWRSRMPLAGSRKLKPAPVGVLLETLSELTERQEKGALAYLLALLLVRRRVLIEEDLPDDSTGGHAPQIWHLSHPADGRKWNIAIELPSSESLAAIQTELANLLFTEE